VSIAVPGFDLSLRWGNKIKKNGEPSSTFIFDLMMDKIIRKPLPYIWGSFVGPIDTFSLCQWLCLIYSNVTNFIRDTPKSTWFK
jgi:hypothetical protein